MAAMFIPSGLFASIFFLYYILCLFMVFFVVVVIEFTFIFADTMVGLYPHMVKSEFQVEPICESSFVTLAMMWYPMDIIIK